MDAAGRMMRLFEGYASAHGTHGEPVQREGSLKWEIRTTARTLREPVTAELWQQHLDGKRPLGVISIREDSRCMWGSIDFDVYDTDITAVIRRAEQLPVRLVPCRSKSGGLHLFLFLAEATPAAEVVEVLRDLAARIGVGGSEIFPKQTRVLEDRGDLGSWMVMPYFGDTYGGRLREQVGLRVTGAELTLEEFLRGAEKARAAPAAVADLVVARRKRGDKGERAAPDAPFSDGPPCLQHLAAEKVSLGGQNNALFHMGVYFKKADPGNWKQRLDDAGRTFLDPPASSEAMQALVRSLERKDYEYKCHDEPMVSHCDVRKCRMRRHGVGSWGEFPLIDGLSVLLSEPVIWFVNVDGERIEVSTGDLSNYGRFHLVCMERLQRCYKLMKQDSWLKQVNEAMEGLIAIDPPPDTAPGALLRELMEEFLVNRQRGNRREDLLSGRPWDNEDRGRIEFRLRDLMKFLTREGHDEMSRGRLTRFIEDMGGGHDFYNIAGKGCNLWHLPSGAFEKTPEVSVPESVKPKEVM